MSSDPDRTLARCAGCDSVLAEPPDTPAERRRPCPSCGSTSRVFEAKASLTIGFRVSSSAIVERRLAEAGFRVQWERLSEGGAWLVRVFDERGVYVDGSVQDDPADALLAVAERLLPGS